MNKEERDRLKAETMDNIVEWKAGKKQGTKQGLDSSGRVVYDEHNYFDPASMSGISVWRVFSNPKGGWAHKAIRENDNGWWEYNEQNKSGDSLRNIDSDGRDEEIGFDDGGREVFFKDYTNGVFREMEYNEDGRQSHYKDNSGSEEWWEYDDGMEISHSFRKGNGDFSVFGDILPPTPIVEYDNGGLGYGGA